MNLIDRIWANWWRLLALVVMIGVTGFILLWLGSCILVLSRV